MVDSMTAGSPQLLSDVRRQRFPLESKAHPILTPLEWGQYRMRNLFRPALGGVRGVESTI
jgi:hypothetical protein